MTIKSLRSLSLCITTLLVSLFLFYPTLPSMCSHLVYFTSPSMPLPIPSIVYRSFPGALVRLSRDWMASGRYCLEGWRPQQILMDNLVSPLFISSVLAGWPLQSRSSSFSPGVVDGDALQPLDGTGLQSGFLPFLYPTCGQRVEVCRDRQWCKATFQRYDYRLLQCPEKRGEPKRWMVSLYNISLTF